MRTTPEMEGRDLCASSDEELAALCKQGDGQAAATELERRYRSLLDGLTRAGTRHQRHSVCDREDARQEANLGLAEAIRRYAAPSDGNAAGWPFRAYLIWLVRNRLRDGCRGRRRAESRLDRSHDAASFLDEPSPTLPGPHAAASRTEADDPLAAAQRHEAHALLARELAALSAAERQLADGWAAGEPLTAIARAIGISYRQVRRLAVHVKNTLAIRLGRPSASGFLRPA